MSQRTFERVVSGVLLTGVTVSAVLMVGGMVAALATGWAGASAAIDPTDFGGLLHRIQEGQPLAVTQLGLVVLILTPVVRVACSVVGFALERDVPFVAITLTVLLILVASLLLFR